MGGVFAELWGGGVASRLAGQGLSDNIRAEIYKASLEVVVDRPLLGTGYGTFEFVFPSYRTGAMRTDVTVDRAHNTPLELAMEVGVPVTLVCFLPFIFGVCVLTKGLLSRRSGYVYPVTGLAVGALGIMHSLVDFPLQIAGCGITWAALLGTCVAQSERSLSNR